MDGAVWANVWYKDVLLRLDPADGAVTGELLLGNLWPKSKRPRTGACLCLCLFLLFFPIHIPISIPMLLLVFVFVFVFVLEFLQQVLEK